MNVYDLKDSQIIIKESDDVRKLYLELTSECNFDCEMCFRHGFSNSFGSMDKEVLNKVLEEIKSLPRLDEVVIGGIGEPLMHPSFQRVADWIKQQNIKLSITSNGALADPHIDFMIEKKVDNLYLSFETGDIGHANETYIFDIAKIIEHRKRKLKNHLPSVHFSMVITRNNIGDLDRVAQALRGSGVSTVFISNLLPTHKEHESLSLYLKAEPEVIKQFKNRLLQKALLEKTRCTTPKFGIQTDRFCNFIEQNALVIRWDGEIAPCYRFLHSAEEFVEGRRKEIKACSFGNIRDKPLLDVWNDRSYAWFRFQVHHSIYPSCIDCPLKNGCEFIKSTDSDCWGNEHSCADCLWSRGIIRCP
ncbi:tungsten cofactor oxidoreductase radical SAM maturase [bacterium]|nr:tungsten cofactor oxidoreductase radical SAM maturase [bacterium]